MVYRRILLLFVSLAILTTAERSQTSAINLVKLQRAFATQCTQYLQRNASSKSSVVRWPTTSMMHRYVSSLMGKKPYIIGPGLLAAANGKSYV